MSHQKHNGRSSNPHRIPKHDELKDVQEKHEQPLLSCPKGDNRDEWRIYWQEQGWSWRTEPEISKERQEELARHRAIPVDIEKGIYPFGGVKLDRADVEWLLVTHENGRGPIVWSDEQQRDRKGLDLRGADLRGDGGECVNLTNLPLSNLQGTLTDKEGKELLEEQFAKGLIQLEGANLSDAILEGANLSYTDLTNVQLSRARLNGAHLQYSNLSFAKLSGASLCWVNLERAALNGAEMEGADLCWAKLIEADLSAVTLDGAFLNNTKLARADLTEARLVGVDLYNVSLSSLNGIGSFLADVKWGDSNLSVVDWSRVILLGEEHRARQKYDEDGTKKSIGTHLYQYKTATRANRQLAVALQGQGLNEDATRFAYRANVLQRKVYWYQLFVMKTRQDEKKKIWFPILRQQVQQLGSYIFSLFLDILAGYGYKPERTVGWYLLVVFGFALAYALFGHLPFWPDALVYSLTSFHGRGFCLIWTSRLLRFTIH